jgi:hypothetical protein
MEFLKEINTGTYADGLLTRLKELGFDNWDIKAEDLEYIFNHPKFRVLHDFLQEYLSHENVITDTELVWFKDIASLMIDKEKSDRLITQIAKSQASKQKEVFSFDTFCDDDNLLDLDYLDIDSTTANSNKTASNLDEITEEFDDYEDTLKSFSTQDLELLQAKLGIELARDEIEEYLGIDTEDTLKQQLISLNSEMGLLEKENKLLHLELDDLQHHKDQKEAILESKENVCMNSPSENNPENAIENKNDRQIEDLHKEVKEFNDTINWTLEFIGNTVVEMAESLIPKNAVNRSDSQIKHFQKISMNLVTEFSSLMSKFCNKLTTVHDLKMQELKNHGNESPISADKEMKPMIESTYDIEKHYLWTQIRELRSKISLKLIKSNKIVVEKDANEERIKELNLKTRTLFDDWLKELKKNSLLKVNKLYKPDTTLQGPSQSSLQLQTLIKHWESQSIKIKNFVYLVSSLVELDKNYTQTIADYMVFINEKATEVK